MSWMKRAGMAAAAASITLAATALTTGGALAAPVAHTATAAHVTVPIIIKAGGRHQGKPLAPTGLGPNALYQAYKLTTSNTSGAGQTIALIDAGSFPNALTDLNTYSKQYGLPQLSTCTSLTQAGACFKAEYPNGKPGVNDGWDVEASLDMDMAHAMAPAAKIILVEPSGSLFAGVTYANSINANEVSMSWGSSGGSNSDFTHAGTIYTASSGDSGHGVSYPATAPGVIAVGGTTLHGCSGNSCTGFTSETAWSGSGGGVASGEPISAAQSSYTGPVSGAATITALTSGKRGSPDVSFEGNPSSGVAVYDTQGQSGWLTVGGTSVGSPAWAGILAAGAAAGQTALQGAAAIYSGGYKTHLRDITSGNNGSCGTNCRAAAGYDLVTGLGSPLSYP